jgi:Uma2 family endonuclease
VRELIDRAADAVATLRSRKPTVIHMTTNLVYPRLATAQLAQRWRELVDQPGVPDRFELDEYGELVDVNPPKKPHQKIVYALMKQIETQLGGEPLPGIGVLTRIGVRIPDVVWQPQWTDEEPADPAPVLCVEVLSPENRRREIEEKTGAYLAAGAREVIVVELGGRIRLFGADGERDTSALGLKLVLPAGTYPR